MVRIVYNYEQLYSLKDPVHGEIAHIIIREITEPEWWNVFCVKYHANVKAWSLTGEGERRELTEEEKLGSREQIKN